MGYSMKIKSPGCLESHVLTARGLTVLISWGFGKKSIVASAMMIPAMPVCTLAHARRRALVQCSSGISPAAAKGPTESSTKKPSRAHARRLLNLGSYRKSLPGAGMDDNATSLVELLRGGGW